MFMQQTAKKQAASNEPPNDCNHVTTGHALWIVNFLPNDVNKIIAVMRFSTYKWLYNVSFFFHKKP